MKMTSNKYHGYRFPREIISHSVWLYHRFALSLRDIEDLLSERGVIVALVHGSGRDRILRVSPPQPGAILDAVPQAQPVQVRQVPVSGTELG